MLSGLRSSLHFHCNGVNLHNLRPVPAVSQWCHDGSSKEYNPTIRLALINVCSLKNKTFILNEFIRARNLDFLFITETWLNAGNMDALGELVLWFLIRCEILEGEVAWFLFSRTRLHAYVSICNVF